MALFRRWQLLHRRLDGDFELHLDADGRDLVRRLLAELDELLDAGPDDADLRRLQPPAYLDDPEADAAYQLLAGEELRASRKEAIAGVRSSLERDRLTEGELWAWARSLNALRLVLGTRLDVSEDEHAPPRDLEPDSDVARLWAVYELVGLLQHQVVRALGS